MRKSAADSALSLLLITTKLFDQLHLRQCPSIAHLTS